MSGLQQLHRQYGSQISEKEFAQEILGIKSAHYSLIKKGDRKGRIIKKESVKLSKEQVENIKKELQQQGYAGKMIDYEEVKKLHQTYSSQAEESDFVLHVLEISSRQYRHMKFDGNKSIILKSLIVQLLPEEIEEIKQELISQGYEGKSIDYIELQKLHKMYGRQMPEGKFAQEVLEIKYPTYIGLKNSKTRMTQILRNIKNTNISLEEIEKIKEELNSLGYAGRAISYRELQELHKTYGSNMLEAEFAQEILELTYGGYYNAKSGNWNTTVLNSLVIVVSSEEIEQIKEQLKLQGYANRLIDYQKIQELHQRYGNQMTEREFAQKVLEISYEHYGNIKNGRKKKAKVLKINEVEIRREENPGRPRLSIQELEKNSAQIKKRLISEGYAGKSIDYQELQNLHQTYCIQSEEKDFAGLVLELTYSQYMHVKNFGKAIILKDEAQTMEEDYIEKIKQELEKQGYVGKTINYRQLQTLYQMYGNNMTESKFAQRVLEISKSQYKRMKNGTRNSIILKSLRHQIVQEEIDRIKQELETQGYSGKKINYIEFQSLYKQYGRQMPENKFAEEILGISVALLGNMMRLPKARAKILKEVTIPISEEEIESIKEVLEAKGYGGKLIRYSELQLLHQTYGSQMREDVFAQVVLEIPRIEYYRRVKENGRRTTKILCYNKKVKLIHGMLFKESRWYSKEEIEQICKENGISLDKIIRNIASNGTSLYNEDYKRVLNEKGKLWIGKVRMSNDFIEKHLKLITKKAKIALRSAKGRFGIRYNNEYEDMIQNAILYLMENAGDIEKNFSNYPEMLERSIFNKIRKQIVISILNNLKIKPRTISLNKRLTPKKKADKAKEGDELGSRISSGYNLEEDVISREEEREKEAKSRKKLETDLAARCIGEMKRQIELGLEKQTILSNIEKKFELSKEELLKMMQNYLITNGAVTIERGRARWNEER